MSLYTYQVSAFPLHDALPISNTKHGVLSWKTYNWGMESVWLENVFLHQPKRWLPEKFSNYDDLLTTAVENAVSGDDVPKDISKRSEEHTSELKSPDHLVCRLL